MDAYFNIQARAGQTGYSFALANKTLAAGHTFKDQVDVCLEALKPYGITVGNIPDLSTTKMPRGGALFYAIAATAWVAMDYGGDTREAWLKAEGAKAAVLADSSIAAEAEAKAASLQAQLDQKSKELDDYVASYKPASDVCPAGDSLDRLPGWRGRD